MAYKNKQKNFLSIVMPVKASDRHVLRCVNSIKRQNFENIKIILLFYDNRTYDSCTIDGVEKNVLGTIYENEPLSIFSYAVKLVNSDLMMICPPDSVLSYNFISECVLDLESLSNKHNIVLGKYNNYFSSECEIINNILFSPFFKVFNTKKMSDIVGRTPSNRNDCLFLLDYYNKYLNNFSHKNIYLYTEPTLNMSIFPQEYTDFKTIEEWIKKLNKFSNFYKTDIEEILSSWLESIDHFEGSLDLASYLLENISDFYLLHMKIAEILIPSSYKTILRDKNAELYRKLQKYLKKLKDYPVLLKSFLEITGYSMIKYDTLISYTFSEYLYITKVKNNKNEKGHFHSQNNTEPEGPALAEYLIDKTAHGKLGFKALFRSVRAWGDFKLKKGK